MALPVNNSPDRQLYHLHQQEEEFVKTGNFLEAERVKGEIDKKEKELALKYERLRESNVRVMMGDLEHKQEVEMVGLLAKRDKQLEEWERMKSRRGEELADRQEREMRELLWVYAE